MYAREHGVPHFHVRCGGKKASIAIATGDILEGGISPRHSRLIERWRKLHEEELMENWQLLQHKQLPKPVSPLKE